MAPSMNRRKALKIDGVKQLGVRFDQILIADHDRHARAAHRIGFGKGIQFNADFHGSGIRQKAFARFAVKNQIRCRRCRGPR